MYIEEIQMHILIVDDDVDLVEGLRWYLEAEGFQTSVAIDGQSAIDKFREVKPDLVILDVMIPKIDGIKVCEIINKESDALIMMLSARDGEIDIVRALKLGADDYVKKPFHISELVARIHAIFRRMNRTQSATVVDYHWRNLEVSLDERRVSVNKNAVELTTLEFDLLVTLMGRPQIVFSRDLLVEKIWGEDFYGELRLVDNLVYRLREKLTGAGCDDVPIATIRGVGYAYRPE